MHSVAVSTESFGACWRASRRLEAARPAGASESTPDPHPQAQVLMPAAGTDQPGQRVSRNPRHPLRNVDLDTGKVVQPGGYRLTDSTYADLLHRLTRQPDQPIPPGIKEDVETYYSNLDLPITTKDDPQAWKQVLSDLVILRTMPTSSEPTPFPTYGDEDDLQ